MSRSSEIEIETEWVDRSHMHKLVPNCVRRVVGSIWSMACLCAMLCPKLKRVVWGAEYVLDCCAQTSSAISDVRSPFV